MVRTIAPSRVSQHVRPANRNGSQLTVRFGRAKFPEGTKPLTTTVPQLPRRRIQAGEQTGGQRRVIVRRRHDRTLEVSPVVRPPPRLHQETERSRSDARPFCFRSTGNRSATLEAGHALRGFAASIVPQPDRVDVREEAARPMSGSHASARNGRRTDLTSHRAGPRTRARMGSCQGTYTM